MTEVAGIPVCTIGLLSQNLPDIDKDKVILGDSFIRAYYTHFDYSLNRIGFVKSKQPIN